jgi:hypothetical protein
MKLRLFGLLILLAISLGGKGQDSVPAQIRPVRFYAGLEPGLSAIPFDEYRYAFDINLLPFTLEYAIDRHFSIRIHSIWDLQIRPEFPAVMSKAGVEIGVPYYFSLKNSEEGQRGFYAAGLVSLVYHRLNNFYEGGVAAEAGYSFLFGRMFSVSIAGQAGLRLQQDPDNPVMRIIPYTAPRITLGFWL